VLNLGSGNAYIDGAVNLDMVRACNPDIVHDLRRFPWPFEDSVFERVIGRDIIEHLPDTVATMEELFRICKSGAVVELTTPHFSSSNAFTDPTHQHQFGYFSFDYFTGAAIHNHYSVARFDYKYRYLVFLPSRKNTMIRRLANRAPAFYERHLCWILPAWFLSVELVVRK
jgi:SAM-dependent methyltransferase